MILSAKKIASPCLKGLAGTLFVAALLMVGTDALAEEPDLRASGELEHSYAEGATVNLAHEHRLRLESLKLHETFTDIGTYYRLGEGFEVGGAYRIIFASGGGGWNLERRPYVDVVASVNVFSIDVSLRPRVEYRIRSAGASLRYSPEIRAELNDVLFQPFVADEVFLTSGGDVQRNRASVGLSPTRTLSVFYLLQTDHADSVEYTNVLGLKYRLDL